MAKINRRLTTIYAFCIAFVLLALIHKSVRAFGAKCHFGVCDVRFSHRLLHIDSLSESDSEMLFLISQYRDSISQSLSRVLCQSNEIMDAYRPESSEMRVLSDVMLAQMQKYADENNLPSPTFAMINVGGIRTILPQGPVTLGDVFQIAPFENYGVIVEVDSACIRKIMNHVALRGGEALSGCKITIEDTIATNITIAGKPLQSGVVYRLATLDYLVDGGDAFDMFWGCKRYDSQALFRNMIVDYFTTFGQKNIAIKDPADQRIFIRKHKTNQAL